MVCADFNYFRHVWLTSFVSGKELKYSTRVREVLVTTKFIIFQSVFNFRSSCIGAVVFYSCIS